MHYQYVEKLALHIFDSTENLHRLSERERLYLQIAAILHDVGKYVNLANHDLHCYNIINSEDIMGLSISEINIIANIARYHSEVVPMQSHENYGVLRNEEKIIVSKLASMLKLAEAMDISHKEKIKDVQITAVGSELQFKVKSLTANIVLEEWSFNQNSLLFEEVMGYKPVIVIKA